MKKFTFFLLGVLIYASADAQSYYRSAANGNWASLTTWEQSPDNVNWATATTVPDQTAASIVVRTGNTVTIAALAAAQTLTIENGGVLQQNAALTIYDGPQAYDFIITGMLVVTVGIPTLNTGAQVLVSANTGYVRIDVNVGGNSLFARNTSIVFEHGATLDWNDNLAFGTSNATYFPNTPANVIPIFKISQNMSIGSNNPTIINGRFIANANVSWTNGGSKTFRNGIGGTGTITQTGTGAFLVSGTTSTLGGTGTLVLNSAGGLTISNSFCTLESDKVVNVGPIVVENGSTLDAETRNISGTASFTLRAGATLISASPAGVNGSITCTGANVFESLSSYTFNGTQTQVTGTLMASDVEVLTIDNDNVVLTQPTQANTLTLTHGILTTKAHVLTVPENGTIIGGSNGSYVYGPLRRLTSTTVPTQYHFPLGDIAKGTNPYRPVTLETANLGGDEFVGEYFFASPPPASGNIFLGLLGGLKNDEYWTISSVGANSTTARVLIPYAPSATAWRWVDYMSTDLTACGYCAVAVTRLNAGGTDWDFSGTFPNAPENPPLERPWSEAGMLSSGVLDEFGIFSVGFSYNTILPIKSIRLTSEGTSLAWHAETSSPIKWYAVEHEKGGTWVKEYETLETTYTPKHNGLYRVKAVSVFDQEVVSNQVYFSNSSRRSLFLFPNPVTNTSLSVYSDMQQRATIETFDGRACWQGILQKGVTILSVDYPAGIYLLRGKWGVQKFVIQ